MKAHPAKFGDDVLDAIAKRLRSGMWVLDPFAGTGRIFELEERVGVYCYGIEIEKEWIDVFRRRHLCADSLVWMARAHTMRLTFDAIATSPTFGNRMADHYEARDVSKRHTYRSYLGRALSDCNSGRMNWGRKYRSFHEEAWALAVALLEKDGLFILNMKDHVRKGKIVPVTDWHIKIIESLGLKLSYVDRIPVSSLAHGQNYDARVPYEDVLTFAR